MSSGIQKSPENQKQGRRIVSLLNKNPFKAIGWIKTNPQDVGVKVNYSNPSFLEINTKGLLEIVENRKTRYEFNNKNFKPLKFWKKTLHRQMRQSIRNLMEKRKW